MRILRLTLRELLLIEFIMRYCNLQISGVRTQLSSSGVLVSARMIQRLAENLSMKQNPTVQEIKSLQERALFLLNFLDDNDCPSMKKLLSENIFDEKAPTKNAVIDRKNNSQSTTLSEIEDSIRNTNGISFSFELNKISWLPVSLENNKVDGPPVKVEGLIAVGIGTKYITCYTFNLRCGIIFLTVYQIPHHLYCSYSTTFSFNFVSSFSTTDSSKSR